MENSYSFANQLDELLDVLGTLRAEAAAVDMVATLISDALRQGRRVLTCGNGGSATDAMHLAQELVGRYRSNRRALPGICLNADVGSLTCIGNDFGYHQIFARQVTALGQAGDVLVCFSTSGASPNVLEALHAARERGIISVALLGRDGGAARPLADHALVVPSTITARIQEVHTLLLHAICERVEHDCIQDGLSA